MDEDWDLGLSARYAARLLRDDRLKPPHRRDILIALAEHRNPLREAVPRPLWDAALAGRDATPPSIKEFAAAWPSHGRAAVKALAAIGKSIKGAKFIKRNIADLAALAMLDKAERRILLALVVHRASWTIENVCDEACYARFTPAKLLALLTRIKPDRVIDILSPSGTLVRTGLIEVDSDGGRLDSRYVLRTGLKEALADTDSNATILRRKLLGEMREPRLTLPDFDHMAAERDFCVSLLSNATHGNETGINILLYGAPGCGKTEFAALIAREAGLSLYAAGEGSLAEGEQRRPQRLGNLALHINLLRGGGAAILFDEIEDVAVNLIERGGSKLHINRVLERNAMPVIWTSNTLDRIDPALVRRMTHVVEFRRPPSFHRARLWQSIAEQHGVAIDRERAAELGRRFDVAPAVISNAVRAAKLTGGDRALDHVATGLVRALGNRPPGDAHRSIAFDPALAQANCDLEDLAGKLARSGDRRVSFCLSGPPGTGKSAYARHVAARLGLEPMEKRASDLLSCWVGGTEQRIAAAFREAQDHNAFLIFDEADSLLHDRARARASWEVTQVNEMLTWMECHPLPFCCTTNLVERLDPASLRRFVFDIRFDYLGRAGLATAWAAFFPHAGSPPQHLAAVTNLTPGDFAKARRGAETLGEAANASHLLAALEGASRAKPGCGGLIGFRVAAE